MGKHKKCTIVKGQAALICVVGDKGRRHAPPVCYSGFAIKLKTHVRKTHNTVRVYGESVILKRSADDKNTGTARPLHHKTSVTAIARQIVKMGWDGATIVGCATHACITSLRCKVINAKFITAVGQYKAGVKTSGLAIVKRSVCKIAIFFEEEASDCRCGGLFVCE